MGTFGKALSRLVFLTALLVVMPARATSIQIVIDTDSLGLNGQNWDLAFDLIDGNPQSNSVTISAFAITGGALTGVAPYPIVFGNVTGDLSIAPGIVTLDDSSPIPGSFFNEYLDNATLGTSLSFILEITANKDSGLDPDTFAFFFVDPVTGLTLPTSDPSGADALFVYSIGNDDQPTQFCPVDIDCLTVTPVVNDVPEPGALALAMAGLLAFGVSRTSRRRLSRR